MAAGADRELSRRERQIMDIIYALQEASARDVLDSLPDPPSYSSVRALLRILEEKGHLKHRGWGAEMGYPGLVLDEAGEEVKGFVFSSEHLSEHWDALDEFEGEQYKRVLTEVYLDDGS